MPTTNINITIDKTTVGLNNVDNTSDANKPVSTAQQTALNLKEDSINKDATGGYAGLTLFKINFKNAANTFTSFFTNSNTAARTYTFQNRDGTVADDTDITNAKARANHTGTQTASTISDFNTAALLAAPAETATTEGALINSATSKATPVDADYIGLMDSAASNILKKLSWANLKATLKAYFDTIYTFTYWSTVLGTPVRVGNTSFTITDTANAGLYDQLISRTTVLKWTDTGVTKLAMVVSATYAANTVTVTIIGDTLTATATMNTFKYSVQKSEIVVLRVAGTLATGNDLTARYYPQTTEHVFGGTAHLGTAGTTNATTFTISKNAIDGTGTVLTAAISVASGATVATADIAATSGTEIVLTDYLTANITGASATTPIDAYVHIFVINAKTQYL